MIVVARSEAPRWIEITEGLALHIMGAVSLEKGAGHKYVRRVPTGKLKPKYRYYYDIGGGEGGVGHESEFKVGAKFKIGTQHYHIEQVGEGVGGIVLRGDESGDVLEMDRGTLKTMLRDEYRATIRKRSRALQAELTSAWMWGSRKQIARLGGEIQRFIDNFGILAAGLKAMIKKDVPRPEIQKEHEPKDWNHNIALHDAAVMLNRGVANWVILSRDFDDTKGIQAASAPTNILKAAKVLRRTLEKELGINWSTMSEREAYDAAKPVMNRIDAWNGSKFTWTSNWKGFFDGIKRLTARDGSWPEHAQGNYNDRAGKQLGDLAAVCSVVSSATNTRISHDVLAVDEYEDREEGLTLVQADLISEVRQVHYGEGKGTRAAMTWLIEQINKVRTTRGLEALTQLLTSNAKAIPSTEAREILSDWKVAHVKARVDRIMERQEKRYGKLKITHNKPNPELDATFDKAIKAAKGGELTSEISSETYGIDYALHDRIGVGHHALWTKEGNAQIQKYFQDRFGAQVNLVDRTFLNFIAPSFTQARVTKDEEGTEFRSRFPAHNLVASMHEGLNRVSDQLPEAERKKRAIAFALKYVGEDDKKRARDFLNMAYERYGLYSFSPDDPGAKPKGERGEVRAANIIKEAAQQSVDAQRRVLRDMTAALTDLGEVIDWPIDLSGLPINVDQRDIAGGANAHYRSAVDSKQLSKKELGGPRGKTGGPHIAVGEDRLEKSLAHEIAHYLDNRMSMRGIARPTKVKTVVMYKLKEAWGPTIDWPAPLLMMHKRLQEAFGRQSEEHGLGAEGYVSNLCAMVSYLEAYGEETKGARSIPGKPDEKVDLATGGTAMRQVTRKSVSKPDALWTDNWLMGREFVATVREAIEEEPGGKEYMGLFDAMKEVGVLRQFEDLDDQEEAFAKRYFNSEHAKYFASGEEMLARMTEQWVHMKLAEKGRLNPSLTHLDYTSSDSYVRDQDDFKRIVAPAVEKFMKMVSKNMTKAMTAATWFQGLLDSLDAVPMVKAEQLGFGFGGGEPPKAKQRPITVRGKPGKGKTIQGRPSKVSAWQPVPGSKIPGAQRQRRGGKYIYRYPAKGGGWSAVPEEHAKPKPKTAEEPAPAGGSKIKVVMKDPATGKEIVLGRGKKAPARKPPPKKKGLHPDDKDYWADFRWGERDGEGYQAEDGQIQFRKVEGQKKRTELLYYGKVYEIPTDKPTFGHAEGLIQKLREDARAAGKSPSPKPPAKEPEPSEPGWERMTGVEKFEHLKERAKAVEVELTFTGQNYKLHFSQFPDEPAFPTTLEETRELVEEEEKEYAGDKPAKEREAKEEPKEEPPAPPPPPPLELKPPAKKEPKLVVPRGADPRQFTDYGGLIEGSRLALAKMSVEDMEANPVLARKLVTKSNVFGDYKEGAALDKAAGVSPAAAWMKRQVLDAVAARPATVTGSAALENNFRHWYRDGATQLMNGLARCQTEEDVKDFLKEWQDSAEGKSPLGPPFKPKLWLVGTDKGEKEGGGQLVVESKLGKPHITVGGKELTKDSDPALLHAAMKHLGRYDMLHDVEIGGTNYSTITKRSAFTQTLNIKEVSELADGTVQLLGAAEGKEDYAKYTLALGKGFAQLANLDVRRRKGAPSLVKYASYAWGSMGREASQQRKKMEEEAGEIKDWSWAKETKKKKDPKAAPQKAEMKVVEKSDKRWVWTRSTGNASRKGPAVKPPEDSQEFAKSFGFPAVNYGSWANDAEREWHVTSANEALHDMARVMGVDPGLLGINSRLKLAFGARGTGGKKAPSAHYEPGGQVINLTKLKGAGSLAHEWGHFMDNAVMLGTEGMSGSKANLISEQVRGQSDRNSSVENLVRRGVPRDIAQAVRDTMVTIKVVPETAAEKQARFTRVKKERDGLKEKLKDAEKASRVANGQFNKRHGPEYEDTLGGRQPHEVGPSLRPKLEAAHAENRKRATEWSKKERQIKAAWMEEKGLGTEVVMDRPPPGGWKEGDKVPKPDTSGVTPEQIADYDKIQKTTADERAAREAIWAIRDADKYDLDTDHYANALAIGGTYYAQDAELFARAFESYIEDKLHGGDQENTYLVAGTREMHISGGDRVTIKSPEPGIYVDPKDPHRAECNAAFDKLLAALKANNQLTKALSPWSQHIDALEAQLGR